MSATAPLPKVADFLGAFETAVRVDHGLEIDTRRYGDLDLLNGPAALLWAAQAERDRSLFRNRYMHTAQGARLEDIVQRRYKVARRKLSRGVGNAVLRRAAAGATGTLWAGTRVQATRPSSSDALVYVIREDTEVLAADVELNVPIEASRPGSGVALQIPSSARLTDTCFDAFDVIALTCADGRDEEPAEEYVARARSESLARRPGRPQRFIDACRAAGAAHVVILDAGELGPAKDGGVSFVYVSDAGYSTPQALLDACSDAVDAVHIAGCDVQVLGMTPTPTTITLDVALWQNPGAFPLNALREAMARAVLVSFNGRSDFWLFDNDTIRGDAQKAGGKVIQAIGVTTDPGPPTPAFVASLPRYTLAGNAVTINFTGPV